MVGKTGLGPKAKQPKNCPESSKNPQMLTTSAKGNAGLKLAGGRGGDLNGTRSQQKSQPSADRVGSQRKNSQRARQWLWYHRAKPEHQHTGGDNPPTDPHKRDSEEK